MKPNPSDSTNGKTVRSKKKRKKQPSKKPQQEFAAGREVRK